MDVHPVARVAQATLGGNENGLEVSQLSCEKLPISYKTQPVSNARVGRRPTLVNVFINKRLSGRRRAGLLDELANPRLLRTLQSSLRAPDPQKNMKTEIGSSRHMLRRESPTVVLEHPSL